MSDNKFTQFKLVLLGESAVGKSSIVHRFVKNTFDDLRESTIGAAFLTQSISLPEFKTTVKFEIWDTAGQERYKSLAPMYYRNANAALCVYDITSRSSFNKAQDWIKELKKQAPEGIIISLVGNKVDLIDKRQVEEDEVLQYIELLNNDFENDSINNSKILHAECSAKSGDGVLDVFNKIARSLPLDDDNSKNISNNNNRRNGGVDLGRNLRQQQNQQSQQNNGCC